MKPTPASNVRKRESASYKIHTALKMGLGHHETKKDLAMPLYLLTDSDKRSDSDSNPFDSIKFEKFDSDTSEE